MMNSMSRRIGVFVAAMACIVVSAQSAEIYHWVGAENTDWGNTNNWNPNGNPGAGDTCILNHTTATNISLSSSTPELAAVEIHVGSRLTFSNWDTVLRATDVTIKNGGVTTCVGPFTNNAPATNRVTIHCTNLMIEAGGSIDVKGRGFSGGINTTENYQDGHGPGGGYGGGGYGGAGRCWANPRLLKDSVYGSAMAPLDPGSGGKGGSKKNVVVGGCGGGAVRIIAKQVVVNGTIDADATPASRSGSATDATWSSGGSGGGIYITCETFFGTNGTVSANGSIAPYGGGGGGGGGRISVVYDKNAQNLLPVPDVNFMVDSGLSGDAGYTKTPGDIGTLYFTDSSFFSPTRLFTGQWLAPDFPAEISLSDWQINNVWARLPAINVTVTNKLEIFGSYHGKFKLEIENPTTVQCGSLQLKGVTFALGSGGGTSATVLNVAEDLTLTDASKLYVYAAATHASDFSGAQVNVNGDMTVGPNSWVYPVAHPTTGAVPIFRMHDLTVEKGGGG